MTNPIEEPSPTMKNVSRKNWKRMFDRLAPTARLTPISRTRSWTTMYMMFATPMPPTASVKLPIRPMKMLKARKK